MTIETNRLMIHTASRKEMLRIIESQTNDFLQKAYREMLQGCLEHPDQREWYAVWMIEGKDGSHVGDLSFKGFNDDGSVEIGYGINENYQGNGYAAEAVNATVMWALQQPGVTRVEAETAPDNQASQRVLEKCGFIPSGADGEEGPRFIRTKRQILDLPYSCDRERRPDCSPTQE